jgi:hypothetical protein
MGVNDREWSSRDPARAECGCPEHQSSEAGDEDRKRHPFTRVRVATLTGRRDGRRHMRPLEVATAQDAHGRLGCTVICLLLRRT